MSVTIEKDCESDLSLPLPRFSVSMGEGDMSEVVA